MEFVYFTLLLQEGTYAMIVFVKKKIVRLGLMRESYIRRKDAYTK